MQTTSLAFQGHSTADIRPLSWQCLMSFEKNFNDNINFFTIGVSYIGGPDIIKGVGDVIQEWDKYDYVDFSDRVISMEWIRDQDSISSVSLAMADIILDNHDGLFTPNAGSIYANNILPYRPIKLYAGFDGENVPVFVGLTEKMPEIDEKSKTAKFHCIDFLYSLFNRPLDQSLMFQNYTTDLILDELLQLAGLTTNQYNLDPGFNVVRFSYFEKGTKLRDAISELMEAEQGRLYMDETGVIQFKNRQNFSNTPTKNFDYSNIVDVQISKQEDIVNVVEIKSDVRTVQDSQKFWELGEAILIPRNSSLDIWADFQDPVTSVLTPTYELLNPTDSFFYINTQTDEEGFTSNTAVTLSSFTAFGKSYKMTFTNSSSIDYFITRLNLWATPARITEKIYLREVDSASIAKYDERVLTIDNNFIQREDEAYSKAHIILGDYGEYGNIKTLDVKGTMAQQLNDAIEIDLPEIAAENYIITKISSKIMNGRFSQLLTAKQRDPQYYFTIGISTIGGTDIIAP